MKKLNELKVDVAAVLFFLIVALGCTKKDNNQTYCCDCTTIKKINNIDYGVNFFTTSNSYCDLTQTEINIIEKLGTYSSKDSLLENQANGRVYFYFTHFTTTTCIIKK